MAKHNGEPFLGVDFYYSLGDFRILRPGYHLADLMEASALKCPRIFMQSELLYEYITQMILLTKPFVLITASNDDIAVPYFVYPNEDDRIETLTRTLLDSSRMVAWYTKNPSIRHSRLHALPIGPKWNWRSTEFFGEDKAEHLRLFHSSCRTPLRNIIQADRKTELVYTYFSLNTTDQPFYQDHVGLRRQVYDQLCETGLIGRDAKPEPVPFGQYIADLSKYRFAISPPGRGIDVHRTWEALMVGTVPVVLSSTLNHLYDGLPVLIVDSYTVLTKEGLEAEWKVIVAKALCGAYNFDKLYSDYWRRKICTQSA